MAPVVNHARPALTLIVAKATAVRAILALIPLLMVSHGAIHAGLELTLNRMVGHTAIHARMALSPLIRARPHACHALAHLVARSIAVIAPAQAQTLGCIVRLVHLALLYHSSLTPYQQLAMIATLIFISTTKVTVTTTPATL
jgi:hypothetical protein